MSRIPYIPETAPFTEVQRQWLNGFLAGLFSSGSTGLLDAANSAAAQLLPGTGSAQSQAQLPLTIYFGTQTGTAEALARKIAAQAKGFVASVVDMAAYAEADIAKQERVLIITSTYGDGDMPDNAQAFWDYLNTEAAPRLENTRFSVLALGDTNYSAFCEAGKKFDARLEALGAKRVFNRADCDTDYESAAKAWTEGALSAMAEGATGTSAVAGHTNGVTTETAKSTGYSKTNPFPARLLTNRILTGADSQKETRHFEIALEGSGLYYEVGDALGVMPANCPELVEAILQTLGCDGEEAVPGRDGNVVALRKALIEHYDITKITNDFLAHAAERTGNSEWKQLLDVAQKDALKHFLWGREIIDLLPGCGFAPAEFVGLLKKLQPRLYSISSSPKAHPGEVHLTVGIVRYDSHGRARKGVCSTFLADRVGEHALPVFIQASHGFRLPANADTPIVMVGPGTGVAPFRAFLEERQAIGANGKNWLFFGDQKIATDFLYREQFEAMQSAGFLKLSTAFSRDQAEKIYVQHRMMEEAATLWSWLQGGAHFYVCGDASRMAKDVDIALHKVAETAGGLSPEAAAEYVKKLKADKRYQRDVY